MQMQKVFSLPREQRQNHLDHVHHAECVLKNRGGKNESLHCIALGKVVGTDGGKKRHHQVIRKQLLARGRRFVGLHDGQIVKAFQVPLGTLLLHRLHVTPVARPVVGDFGGMIGNLGDGQ